MLCSTLACNEMTSANLPRQALTGQCWAADASAVPHLVDGIVTLHERKDKKQTQRPPPLWHSHVLVKALYAHPEAAVQLLAYSGSLSQQAAPFQSFVLLSGAGSSTHNPSGVICVLAEIPIPGRLPHALETRCAVCR